MPTATYRTQAFLDAARKLDLDVVCASERPNVFEAKVPDNLVTVDFADLAKATETVAAFHRAHPLRAVVPVDDLTTVAAAAIAERLGLRANTVAAAAAARNKHLQRQRLHAAGVPVPRFHLVSLGADPGGEARWARYPCVLKPLMLSASRGVIRANDEGEFVTAVHRIAEILKREPNAVTGLVPPSLLCEEFVPGVEVALEGLLVGGALQTLAIFDKPDPLDGPFFEETIYVTPSRLPAAMQGRISAVTAQGASSLGLTEGPIHAELRVNDAGPWVLEIAARSIGGLCSRVLRFGTGMSLEEIILRHALGRTIDSLDRERRPAGVMMIPIPKAGRLQSVSGIRDAERVPGIEEITISAHAGQELVPLPEGSQYLGFIFARGDSPEAVEQGLRSAHARLRFEIT